MALRCSSSGTVVAITGAGQGIGRGLALAFARDGARGVVVSDIDVASAATVCEEVRALGCQALAVRADVASAADCATLVGQTVRALGRLDVMVCNAGITQLRPLLELDGDDWDRMMSVNVRGTFLTLQAAARQMLEQSPLSDEQSPPRGGIEGGSQQSPPAPPLNARPRGKIITIASIAGRSGAGPIASVIAPYRASKAAVISLTQSAAITLAPQVTVNAICPGLVETDMWKRMDRDWTTLQGVETGQAWKQRVATVPMGRPQQPDDVAALALYLASPASDYMTGQSINIDGGLMMN